MAGVITTHVLDTSTGHPAAGVPVLLERQVDGDWIEVGSSETDSDGRAGDLGSSDLPHGTYRLTFNTSAYYGNRDTFYPYVNVVFRYTKERAHYHVPLLISPYGYSTYRGS